MKSAVKEDEHFLAQESPPIWIWDSVRKGVKIKDLT